MDGRLVILNKDGAGISNFRVYSIQSDIEKNLTKATLEHTWKYSGFGYE